MAKREKKYLNTKCDWCLKASKSCDFHQKYSYKRCLKELVQEKWARLKWRIILGIFMGIVVLGLFLGMQGFSNWNGLDDYEKGETLVLFTKSVIAFPFLILIIMENEKFSQKWIKEKVAEKQEWKEINQLWNT